MSLLSEAMEDFVMIDKTTAPDGYGGKIDVYIDGASIKAAVTLDTSMQSRIASVQGVTALYTVITEKNINLQYHDILRRVSDGKVFRITSDGDDVKTPASASLNMRVVTAEEWVIPNG